jgi:hypothetical protein
MLLVRSYRTFAPLPALKTARNPQHFGGMFLWHYPHGRPHWALPSKSGLWEARTFLNVMTRHHAATASPALSLSQCKGKPFT